MRSFLLCVFALVIAGQLRADAPTTVTLPDGSIFVGEILVGKFHGSGTLTYPNGDVYQGLFKHGYMSGQGHLTTHDGASYSGNFTGPGEDFRGNGTIEFAGGDRYEGQWRHFRAHGSGTYFTIDGDVYEGLFEDGAASGAHKVTYSDGTVYEGSLSDWVFDGEGSYSNEHASYTGEFVDGQIIGKAIVTTTSDARYEGELEYWKYSGAGKLTAADGETYEGNFDYGRYHGQGTLVLADGSGYQGDFRYGKFHGKGTLTWREDDELHTLSGPWSNGYYSGVDYESYVESGHALPQAESILYEQQETMATQLATLPTGTKGRTEIFPVAFAPFARENVFLNEIQLLQRTVSEQFQDVMPSVLLSNNPKTRHSLPMATATNLNETLSAVGKRMNREDILFLYITSHGSKDGRVSISYPGVTLRDLTADELAASMDDANIPWRVIVISACYSGTFIPSLQTPNTMVITSAHKERTSFGCGDNTQYTYFGEAFLAQAIPASDDLEDAFYYASKEILKREVEESLKPSLPQIWVGSDFREKKLARLMSASAKENSATKPSLELSARQ